MGGGTWEALEVRGGQRGGRRKGRCIGGERERERWRGSGGEGMGEGETKNGKILINERIRKEKETRKMGIGNKEKAN